jgi:hypothetical protein
MDLTEKDDPILAEIQIQVSRFKCQVSCGIHTVWIDRLGNLIPNPLSLSTLVNEKHARRAAERDCNWRGFSRQGEICEDSA